MAAVQLIPDVEFTLSDGQWSATPYTSTAARYLREQLGLTRWVGEAALLDNFTQAEHLSAICEEDGFRTRL